MVSWKRAKGSTIKGLDLQVTISFSLICENSFLQEGELFSWLPDRICVSMSATHSVSHEHTVSHHHSLIIYNMQLGFISSRACQNPCQLHTSIQMHWLWCTDTSTWSTYRVVSYPILHFLHVKSMSHACLWRVSTISMPYLGIIACEIYNLVLSVSMLMDKQCYDVGLRIYPSAAMWGLNEFFSVNNFNVNDINWLI